MTNDINVYKNLLTIELKDGTILYSDKTIEQLSEFYRNSGDLLEIDGVLFNKYEFKKAYNQKINGIEGYILTLDKEMQRIIRQREKEKKEKVGKGFESIEEIRKHLESKDFIN